MPTKLVFTCLACMLGVSAGMLGFSSAGDQKAGLKKSPRPEPITLFLSGDVMLGRGIDQVLPYPNDPLIHEPYLRSARGYVDLAEEENGLISQPVSWSYVWGAALEVLDRVAPDLRIINLETSITKSDTYDRGKEIHYRMHPRNIPCLSAAGIDYCTLANNHLLDWGTPGLTETLTTLESVNIQSGGAGQNIHKSQAPTVLEVEGKGRVIILSYGSVTSGIPASWAATEKRSGVNLLPDLSRKTVRSIGEKIEPLKHPGDIVVFSIHWGGNWGYNIPAEQIDFAHRLIDQAGVDVVHGHSSHHVKGIEIYKDKPIIYGCGDFLNDYEGIPGYDEYRGDLSLMYFVSMDPGTGKLVEFQMIPTQVKRFQIQRASRMDARWLTRIISREGIQFGTRAELVRDTTLILRWD